jgi:hypothetical protein
MMLQSTICVARPPSTDLIKLLPSHHPPLFSCVPPFLAELAVDAVLRLKGSSNLEYIQIIKKSGGTLKDSFLAEGFLLDKKIGVGQVRQTEKTEKGTQIR